MVSVIIPNYNHAPYLRQRIDSVLGQTYQDIEVIILDDCSEDNSQDIIETYRAHPKVRHIEYNRQNSGSVFRQSARGIQLAKGDFVWIAESDDTAAPELLEVLTGNLEKYPTAALAYCDSNIISAANDTALGKFREIRNKLLGTTKWNESYFNEGRQEIKDCLLKYCTINNASAVLFRKKELLQTEPFDMGFKYYGDWYVYLKMCLHYDLCYSHLPLNNYREHAGNASINKQRNGAFVRESFLIAAWARKNLPFISGGEINRIFLPLMRYSLIKYWNWERVKLWQQLFKADRELFFSMVKYNMTQPLKRFVHGK